MKDPSPFGLTAILCFVLALACFAAAAFAALQRPYTKITTAAALQTLDREFVKSESLTGNAKSRYDFMVGAIKGNLQSYAFFLHRLRTLGMVGFSGAGIAFLIVGARVK